MEVVGDFSVGKPASECNGKAIESRFPVVKRHGPLPGDVLEWQVDDLKGRFIGGKNPMVARHLAQGHVQRLNGVGGVDHAAKVFWKGKPGDHMAPGGRPEFADGGGELIPLLRK